MSIDLIPYRNDLPKKPPEDFEKNALPLYKEIAKALKKWNGEYYCTVTLPYITIPMQNFLKISIERKGYKVSFQRFEGSLDGDPSGVVIFLS